MTTSDNTIRDNTQSADNISNQNDQHEQESDQHEQESFIVEDQQMQLENLDLDSLKEKAKFFLQNYEKVSKEKDKLYQKMLMALAEKENQAKRHKQELAKIKKYFVEDIAKEIIGVMDDVCRASNDSFRGKESFDSLNEVISLTKKQLDQFLNKFNVKSIEVKKGDTFNYQYHHAISQKVDNSCKEDTILEVIQTGYILEDRLLRAALVIVSKKDE